MNFIKTKFSALDGQTKVAFTDDTGREDSFSLIAQGDGVHFKGTHHIANEQDLQDFAKLLSQVWQERRKLDPARKLGVASLSEH